jgi:type II secretion system protein G
LIQINLSNSRAFWLKKRPVNIMKRLFPVLTLIVVAFSAAVWAYFSPHRTVSRIKGGMERSDADTLSHDIDFPTLRSNLKDQLNYLTTSQAMGEMKDNPFAALGVMLGQNLVNNILEAYVTPYGLSQILTRKFEFFGDKPQRPQPADKQTLDHLFHSALYGYDSPSRFLVTLGDEKAGRMKLVLTRSGLSWRLTNVLLPADFANSRSYSVTSVEMTRAVKADVQVIKTQLQLYESISGFYPTTEQGLWPLVAQPDTDPRPARWYQLFKDLPKDPWGSDYIYRCPGQKNPNSYDLFSAGPDRKPDTADDEWGG